MNSSSDSSSLVSWSSGCDHALVCTEPIEGDDCISSWLEVSKFGNMGVVAETLHRVYTPGHNTFCTGLEAKVFFTPT